MPNKVVLEITVQDNGSAAIRQFGQTANQAFDEVRAGAAKTDTALSAVSATLKQLAVVTAAAFGVHEMSSYVKEAALLAARVETLGVVLGVVGENAGYSKGEMMKYAEEVKKMGITTEAAYDACIKIAQAQINMADAAKLARVAQDAAVIGNINSSEAFERMIQGIRSGEVEILKTIGLTVNFEQAYIKMAKALGKSTDALTEQEKAQARANVVMEAGSRIAGSYEAAMGTAGKMMTSLARYAEELKLGFGEVFGVALTEAVTNVTELMKDMTATMVQMRDSGGLKEMADLVATGLKLAWIGVKDAVTAVWAAVKPIGTAISEILPLLGVAASGWGMILAALKPVGVIIGEIIQSVYNLGKLVGSAFGALGAALAGDFASAKQYAAQLDATWGSLKQSAGNAYKAVTDGVAAAVIAYQQEAAAAVTVSKTKTATELAAEEAISKARAEAARQAMELRKQQEEADRTRAERAVAVAKAAYEQERALAKTFYKDREDFIKTEEAVLKASGASEVQIAQHTLEIKRDMLNEYAVTEMRLIEQEAAARSQQDRAKLSDAEYMRSKLIALTIEVWQRRQEIANEERILEAKRDEERRKGAEAYKKLVAEEYEFAATENERAINKIIKDAAAKEEKLKQLRDAGYISEREYADALALVHDNKNKAIIEKETKGRQEIAEINAKLYKNIDGYAEEAYWAAVERITAQAEAWKAKGADIEAVNRWVAEETKKAYIEMGISSDDWVAGVIAALDELAGRHTTWGASVTATIQTFAAGARDELQNNLVTVMKGRFDEIGVDWAKLWDNALKTFAGKLADMAIEAAAKEVVMVFKAKWASGASAVLGIIDKVLGLGAGTGMGGISGGPAVAGGYSGGSYAGFARGGLIPGEAPYPGDHPANDNRVVVVSPGEYIMPRSAVHAGTIGVLEYIRRTGRVPMYWSGGIVDQPLVYSPHELQAPDYVWLGPGWEERYTTADEVWEARKLALSGNSEAIGYYFLRHGYLPWPDYVPSWDDAAWVARRIGIETTGEPMRFSYDRNNAAEAAEMMKWLAALMSYKAATSGGHDYGWPLLNGAERIPFAAWGSYVHPTLGPGFDADVLTAFWVSTDTIRYIYRDGSIQDRTIHGPGGVQRAFGSLVQLGIGALSVATGQPWIAAAMAATTAAPSRDPLTIALAAASAYWAAGRFADGDYFDNLLKSLKGAGISFTEDQLLGILLGGEGGSMSVSFEGADDGGLMRTLSEMMSGVGPNGEFRFRLLASGGPYRAGEPFWAGEEGPELIFPGGPGHVLSHRDSVIYAAMTGGRIPGYASGTIDPRMYATAVEYRRDVMRSTLAVERQAEAEAELSRLIKILTDALDRYLPSYDTELIALRNGFNTTMTMIGTKLDNNHAQIMKAAADSIMIITTGLRTIAVSVEPLNAGITSVRDAVLQLGNAIGTALSSATASMAAAAASAPTTSADPIESLYQTILMRSSDPGGKAYYTAQMTAGRPLADIAADMYASPEYAALRAARGYASGGIHTGGWRWVGEEGPELEWTPPSIIYSAAESRALIDNSEVVAELKQLRLDVRRLASTVSRQTGRIADYIESWDVTGLPETRT